MSISFKEAIVLALWVVTVWRYPSTKGHLWKRALWFAFAGLAAALSFSLTRASSAIDELSGVTALSALFKHLAGIVAITAVLEWVSALLNKDERRTPKAPLIIAGVTAVSMAAIFGFLPRQKGDFTQVMAGDRLATIYLLIFQTYLGVTMTLGATMFVLAAMRHPTRLNAAGLWVLFSGAALGIVYALTRSAFLLESIGIQVPGPAHAYFTVSENLQLIAILLILVGTSMPAYHFGIVKRAEQWNLLALRPMWRRTTTSVPTVLINGTPSLRADLRAAEARLRLSERTTEIRDALLRLHTYVPDTELKWVREDLAAAGLKDEDLDAAIEATWLTAAIRARTEGRETSKGDRPPMPGGADLDSEVAWLRRIHRARRDRHVRNTASELTRRLSGATS